MAIEIPPSNFHAEDLLMIGGDEQEFCDMLSEGSSGMAKYSMILAKLYQTVNMCTRKLTRFRESIKILGLK